MKTISIRVTEKEKNYIQQAADEKGQTLSDYVRYSIRRTEEKIGIAEIVKHIAKVNHESKFLRIFLEELTRRMFKDAQKGEEVLKETLRESLERISEEK